MISTAARGVSTVFVIARDRLTELIAAARESLVRTPGAPDGTAAAFQAAWATSRAAGFLEAITLVDPEHADEMLAEFEAVAALVEDLSARGATES